MTTMMMMIFTMQELVLVRVRVLVEAVALAVAVAAAVIIAAAVAVVERRPIKQNPKFQLSDLRNPKIERRSSRVSGFGILRGPQRHTYLSSILGN